MSKSDKSTSVYDDLGKEMEKTGDERFVRLEDDGDSVMGFFAGTPHSRFVYWDGTQYQEWSEGCGQKKSLRISQNFIVCSVEDGELEILCVKVLEQGKKFFKNVMKRDAKYGIQNHIFEIERAGAKGDSDTTYSIDTEHKLTSDERKKLLGMKLYDLENLDSENASDSSDDEDDDDGVINDSQKNELVKLFKAMEDPEGEGRKFCKKYDIKKVAELQKSKFKKAVKHLDNLINGLKTDDDDDKPF